MIKFLVIGSLIMTVKQLLDEKGRIAYVEVRTPKGNQLLFSGSQEDFLKNGYTGDSQNTISVQEIMSMSVCRHIQISCNSIIIGTM